MNDEMRENVYGFCTNTSTCTPSSCGLPKTAIVIYWSYVRKTTVVRVCLHAPRAAHYLLAYSYAIL